MSIVKCADAAKPRMCAMSQSAAAKRLPDACEVHSRRIHA